MLLPKYSMGIGDRFAHQGAAQLGALLRAAERQIATAVPTATAIPGE